MNRAIRHGRQVAHIWGVVPRADGRVAASLFQRTVAEASLRSAISSPAAPEVAPFAGRFGVTLVVVVCEVLSASASVDKLQAGKTLCFFVHRVGSVAEIRGAS